MTGIYTEKYADAFSTTLTAAITSTARPVTFTVAANSAQLPSGNFRVAIFNVVGGNPVNIERLEVTAVSGLSWTATTEASSVAVTHPIGSTVQTILTAASLIQDMVDHTTPVTVADPHTQYLRKATFTTKGDSVVGTGPGTITRESVGPTGTVLTADPTSVTGRSWKSAALNALTSIGDLLEMFVGGPARLPIGTPGQLLTATTNPTLIPTPSVAATLANAAGTSTWVASTTYFIGYTWVLGLPGGALSETPLSPLTTYNSATPSVQAVTTPAFPAVPTGASASQLNIYVGTTAGTMHQVIGLVPPSTTTTNTVNVSGPNVTGPTPPTLNTTGGFGASWQAPALATLSIVTKTAAYAITAADNVILADATAAAFTITLPAASSSFSGRKFTIKKVDATANAVTVAAAGADTIDGVATKVIAVQNATLDVVSDGISKWVIDPLATPGFTNPMTAVGDLITGGAAGTPVRLGPPGTSGTVLTSTGATTAPSWQTATGGGGGGGGSSQPSVPSIYQQTKIRGTGNKTTTSTSYVAIDNTNLPPLSLTLNSGDIVRCLLMCESTTASGSGAMFDFQVVQPTLGTVRANPTAAGGTTTNDSQVHIPTTVVTTFTAAESGVHTFQPVWATTVAAITITVFNATTPPDQDTEILFSVERVGVTVVPPASQSSLIQEVVLGAAAATISLANIPQTYRDLRLVIQGSGDTAATSINVNAQLNGDTAANYDWSEFEYNGGATGVAGGLAATSSRVAILPAATAPASTAGQVDVSIPNYAATTFQKTLASRSTYKTGTATINNLLGDVFSGWWRSTAAITSIVLAPSTGNFAAGTVVRLYGEPATPLPKIGEVVLTAATASISFASIPQTYRNLRLTWQARGDTVAVNTQLRVQINGDTTASYDAAGHFASATPSTGGAGAGSGVAQTAGTIADISAASAPAGASGTGVATLPNYPSTTFRKSISSYLGFKQADTAAGTLVEGWFTEWRNTAAVTSIVLFPAAGNFLTGSVFTLYGEP